MNIKKQIIRDYKFNIAFSLSYSKHLVSCDKIIKSVNFNVSLCSISLLLSTFVIFYKLIMHYMKICMKCKQKSKMRTLTIHYSFWSKKFAYINVTCYIWNQRNRLHLHYITITLYNNLIQFFYIILGFDILSFRRVHKSEIYIEATFFLFAYFWWLTMSLVTT